MLTMWIIVLVFVTDIFNELVVYVFIGEDHGSIMC